MTKLQQLQQGADEARVKYMRARKVLDVELGRLKAKLEECAPENAYVRANTPNTIFADAGAYVIKYTRGRDQWNVTHSGKELPPHMEEWNEKILQILETK